MVLPLRPGSRQVPNTPDSACYPREPWRRLWTTLWSPAQCRAGACCAAVADLLGSRLTQKKEARRPSRGDYTYRLRDRNPNCMPIASDARVVSRPGVAASFPRHRAGGPDYPAASPVRGGRSTLCSRQPARLEDLCGHHSQRHRQCRVRRRASLRSPCSGGRCDGNQLPRDRGAGCTRCRDPWYPIQRLTLRGIWRAGNQDHASSKR